MTWFMMAEKRLRKLLTSDRRPRPRAGARPAAAGGFRRPASTLKDIYLYISKRSATAADSRANGGTGGPRGRNRKRVAKLCLSLVIHVSNRSTTQSILEPAVVHLTHPLPRLFQHCRARQSVSERRARPVADATPCRPRSFAAVLPGSSRFHRPC